MVEGFPFPLVFTAPFHNYAFVKSEVLGFSGVLGISLLYPESTCLFPGPSTVFNPALDVVRQNGLLISWLK